MGQRDDQHDRAGPDPAVKRIRTDRSQIENPAVATTGTMSARATSVCMVPLLPHGGARFNYPLPALILATPLLRT